jgi:hypothetical protein
VPSVRRHPIPAVIAGGCILTTQSITLIAALLSGTLILLVTVLALLAVLSKHRHQRQAASDILTLIIGILRPRHRANAVHSDAAPAEWSTRTAAPDMELSNIRSGRRSSGQTSVDTRTGESRNAG